MEVYNFYNIINSLIYKRQFSRYSDWATGWMVRGSNPGGDEIFRPSRSAHPAYCKMGTGSFPGVKCGRGVLLTTHPLLVPRSWKSRAIPLPTLGHTGPVTGSLYLYLFTYLQMHLLVLFSKVRSIFYLERRCKWSEDMSLILRRKHFPWIFTALRNFALAISLIRLISNKNEKEQSLTTDDYLPPPPQKKN